MPSQLDRLESYFSAHAAEWQDLYHRPRQVNDLVLANRRQLGLKGVLRHSAPGGWVLDAGCGAGLTALDLAQHGFGVHGIDLAESMLELCRRRFQEAGIPEHRYRFTRESLTSGTLPAGSFDAAIALGFLEYQEDEQQALRELQRLLAPGGALVVSGATERTLANYLGFGTQLAMSLSRLGLAEPVDVSERLWLHRYSCRRFRQLLEATGFELLECQGHGFVQIQGLAGRVGYRGELVIHRALSALAKLLPIGRFGNDTICYARKRR